MALLPTIKLRSYGRGTQYSPLRGLIETTLRIAYPGAWPGRAWGLVPGATNVRRVEHTLPLLPSGRRRPPLRVGFISDVHFGPTTPPRVIENAFAALVEAAPDVLLLGGDYVYLEADEAMARALEEQVRRVPARTKLAVWGNHDLWTRHDLMEQALERAGATVLVNDARRLPPPWDDVAVLGLDEPWTGTPDASAAVAACGDAKLRLGLVHAPEGVPHLAGRDVPLVICGHTHGGQIALPWGPIVVHGEYGKRWHAGLWNVEGLNLYVSRGIGGSELPMRIYAPPEVALLTLT